MRQIQISLFLLFIIISFCSCGTGTTHVQGQLLCHGRPVVGEKIELWEKNFGLPDNLIISETTDSMGHFMMKGSIDDWMRHPIVYVYFVNYCEPAIINSFMTCGNTVKVFIPPEFVTSGNLPDHTFNLDALEMSTARTEQVGLELITHSIFSHKECRPL